MIYTVLMPIQWFTRIAIDSPLAGVRPALLHLEQNGSMVRWKSDSGDVRQSFGFALEILVVQFLARSGKGDAQCIVFGRIDKDVSFGKFAPVHVGGAVFRYLIWPRGFAEVDSFVLIEPPVH